MLPIFMTGVGSVHRAGAQIEMRGRLAQCPADAANGISVIGYRFRQKSLKSPLRPFICIPEGLHADAFSQPA